MFFKASIESVRHEPANTGKNGTVYPASISILVTDKTRGPRLQGTAMIKVTPEQLAAIVADCKKATKGEDLQDQPATITVERLREFSGMPFVIGQIMYGHEHYNALRAA